MEGEHIILKWILQSMDWNNLAKGRDKWCVFVNMVMNLGLHKCREFVD
jgi:hypothetical protein